MVLAEVYNALWTLAGGTFRARVADSPWQAGGKEKEGAGVLAEGSGLRRRNQGTVVPPVCSAWAVLMP